MEKRNLIPFEGKEIRKTWHNDEWYFSVVDVIAILTESNAPSDYWTTMKRREKQLPTNCRKFKFIAADNKMRPTDCANTEGILRIIMSVPSFKAEPLKLWLAEQGKRTLDETENPELLTERQAELYAGEARERVEIGTGKKVVSEQNYLHLKGGETENLPKSKIRALKIDSH